MNRARKGTRVQIAARHRIHFGIVTDYLFQESRHPSTLLFHRADHGGTISRESPTAFPMYLVEALVNRNMPHVGGRAPEAPIFLFTQKG
jgi:hypothetical protein